MKLVKRIAVAAVLIAAFFAMLYLGKWALCAAFTVLAVISVFEMGNAFAKKDLRPFMAPAFMFALLYFVAYIAFGSLGLWGIGMAALLMVMGDRAFCAVRKTEDSIAAAFTLVYPLALYAALPLLTCYGDDINKGRLAILCAFAMPLVGDTFAYFGGSLFGKKKLCPKLSPNKTVAGSIGGVIGGGIGGLALYFVQGIFSINIGAPLLISLGIVLGAAGQLGDLFASSIKRYAGIKDFGNIFSEHGGATDRVDSVLFCAPIVYAAFRIFGV